MDERKRNRKIEWILAGIAFLFFFIMAVSDLTKAPIWYDEAIEYFYSKYPSGPIRGFNDMANMYERIIHGSYQPPLYNAVMYLWLKFGDSEWWYRFSGVVMGMIGAGGLYGAIKRIGGYRLASLSVILFGSIYQIIYYLQECAEYSLLIMLLPWTLLFYLAWMQDLKLRDGILFAVFAALCMYTQYGVAFMLIPLIVSAFAHVLLEKEWKSVRKLGIVYLVTFLAAGVPLAVFFLWPQFTRPTATFQVSTGITLYKNNIFADFFQMLLDVLRWNTIESMTRFDTVAALALLVLCLLGIYCLWRGKSKVLKHLILCNVVTWFLYYGITRAEIYAYGYFGNRYNLFLIPLWLVTILFMLIECYKTLEDIPKEKLRKYAKRAFQAAAILSALCYCVYGTHQINKRWEKADTRGCVAFWYEREGYQVPTVVNWDQTPSFTYYYERTQGYDEQYEGNIHRQLGEPKYNEEETRAYLDRTFPEGMPEELYYIIGDRYSTSMLDILEEAGYHVEEIFKTTSGVYHVYR